MRTAFYILYGGLATLALVALIPSGDAQIGPPVPLACDPTTGPIPDMIGPCREFLEDRPEAVADYLFLYNGQFTFWFSGQATTFNAWFNNNVVGGTITFANGARDDELTWFDNAGDTMRQNHENSADVLTAWIDNNITDQVQSSIADASNKGTQYPVDFVNWFSCVFLSSGGTCTILTFPSPDTYVPMTPGHPGTPEDPGNQHPGNPPIPNPQSPGQPGVTTDTAPHPQDGFPMLFEEEP